MALARLSRLEAGLSKVQTLVQAKAGASMAEALRKVAKDVDLGLDAQNHAALVKILYQRAGGLIVGQIERKQGARKGEDGLRSMLERSEIPVVTAHRWQAISTLTEEDIRKLGAKLTEDGEDLTSALVYNEVRGKPHVGKNAGESEWYTPAEIIEAARITLGEIDLDPASHKHAQAVVKAAKFYTADDDGLAQEWAGRVFLNPPYSQPLVGDFCRKLIESVAAGSVPAAVTLTNNATETEWGQSLLRGSSSVCFPAGRIAFWAPGRKSAPLQGQMVCYLGSRKATFVSAFEEFGIVL